jgi:hypothetical protein
LSSRGDATGNVVAVLRRQANVADLRRQAEPAKNFHGSGRDLIALDIRRLARFAQLSDRDIDPAPGEVDGERQADGSSADDENARFDLAIHF